MEIETSGHASRPKEFFSCVKQTRRTGSVPLSYEEEAHVKRFSPMWLSVLITLLVETGLRVRKEALPLRWQDVVIDSDPACIHVRDSKSAAGLRTVWLTNHCRNILLKWRDKLDPDFSLYVFPSSRLPKMHLTDYKKAWHK